MIIDWSVNICYFAKHPSGQKIRPSALAGASSGGLSVVALNAIIQYVWFLIPLRSHPSFLVLVFLSLYISIHIFQSPLCIELKNRILRRDSHGMIIRSWCLLSLPVMYLMIASLVWLRSLFVIFQVIESNNNNNKIIICTSL